MSVDRWTVVVTETERLEKVLNSAAENGIEIFTLLPVGSTHVTVVAVQRGEKENAQKSKEKKS